MGLSSNSIIHFTNSKEALQGILTENFKIFYCKETIVLHKILFEYHVPMVSFCDIPLSEIKNHIDSYGAYGIGLTKEWAIKNRLNPVMYMEPNSFLSENYIKLKENFKKGQYETYSKIPNDERVLYDFFRYMKNYQGKLSRQGTTTEDYRFSDEREWRYVISHEENIEGMYLPHHFDKIKANDSIKQYRLKFDPNDIKYVIINDENEIEEFLDLFQKEKGKKYTFYDIQRLSTRIITSEQIKKDF